jgi:hypothetical protein
VTVAGTPERSAVLAHARELVECGRRHGYRVDQLTDLVEAVAASRAR